MKRRPRKATLEDSELVLPDLPAPDCRDIEQFHQLCASGRLTDLLDTIAGFADAADPNPSALLNAINTPSRRKQ